MPGGRSRFDPDRSDMKAWTRSRPSVLTLLVGGLMGASFFLWIGGWRLAAPLEYEWAMKWGWPPGIVSGYYHAPDGTSIGCTDSLPLVAFMLKPFSSVLPKPLQYLGLWLTFCFSAQGWWGIRLAALSTHSVPAQLCAAALLILTPTLLNRAVHPALCAQWLLLWRSGSI